MAQYLISDTYMTGIADAIRTKLNTTDTYTPGEMSGAINSIPVASAPLLQTKTISPEEYQQIINADNGYDGLSSVTVSAISNTYVGSKVTKASGTTIIPSNTEQTAIAANTYALNAIKVAAVPSETKSITSNGTYTPSSGKWFSSVTVNVPTGATINNQEKTATPSEEEQEITFDSGYTGLSKVTVGAISSTYVGSGITSRSSSDLTVSGATVNVPAGYYSATASKAVSTMTLPTAATSSATSGFTSKATISRSTSDQYINIPIGYNSAGAYYKISAVANGSVTAPSTISGTTATVSTGTNTITLTKTVSVTPNVTTAGYISAGTAGNASVSLTASVTTKAAATITPTTTNQTIAAGTYLTGIQTISGDSNLVASNIISGKSIFGVNGSVVINKYYTGTSAPASSLGSNGDIYLQE